MEETDESNGNKKLITKRRSFKDGGNSHAREHHHHYHYHHQHQLLQYSTTHFGFCNHNEYQRYYPALLPLPSLIPLQLAFTPPFPQNQEAAIKSKIHPQKSPCKLNNSRPFAASSDNNNKVSDNSTVPHGNINLLSLGLHVFFFRLKYGLFTQQQNKESFFCVFS